MDWGGGSEKTVLESVRDGAVRAGGVKYNPTTLGDMRRWTFIRKRGGGMMTYVEYAYLTYIICLVPELLRAQIICGFK